MVTQTAIRTRFSSFV